MDNDAKKGHLHPLTSLLNESYKIFRDIGYEIALGTEIESEEYNFDKLNIPKFHPARDMQDTFWLKPLSDRKVLRTHTSPMQVRFMEENKPPMKVIVPGKVFRNEATDATHDAQFIQIEGMYIDKNVSLAIMKGVLLNYFQKLISPDIKVRFRPSFFPFTEPSVEVDISCFKCNGDGCNICSKTGWIEVGGGGMMHPNVLKNGGIDPKEWRGFAFGMGVDRLLMLRYGIEDVRLLYSGDLRLVNQF